jgi:hypothetical protein
MQSIMKMEFFNGGSSQVPLAGYLEKVEVELLSPTGSLDADRRGSIEMVEYRRREKPARSALINVYWKGDKTLYDYDGVLILPPAVLQLVRAAGLVVPARMDLFKNLSV